MYTEKCKKSKALLAVPTRDSQKVMPPLFHFMIFPSWTCEHFKAFHRNIAEGTVTFQCSLHLCRQTPFTFEREHVRVFAAGTSCSPSSAATGAGRSAAPRHWLNGVLAGCF